MFTGWELNRDKVAYVLAKQACGGTNTVVWHETPSCIHSLLVADCNHLPWWNERPVSKKNLYISLYNFSQILRWFDSPKFLKWLIIWNGGSRYSGVRNMAPLGHCLWFWWLYDNAINETNKFVKWIFLDPKNVLKSISKAKHEERTQRNAELDELCKNQ